MLFPSATKCSADDKEDEAKRRGADWLENKSFTSQTAKKVVEFQRELTALQEALGSNEEKDDQISIVKTEPTSSKIDIEVKDTSAINKIREDKDKRKYDVYKDDHHRKRSKDQERDDTSDRHYKDKKKKVKHHSSDEESGYSRNSKGPKSDDVDYHKSRRHKEKKKKKHHSSDASISDDDERQRRKKKKKHSSKHKKHKDKSRSPERHNVIEPTSGRGIFTANAVFLDDLTSDIAPEDAYRLDRKSDKNSWAYGSLYKQHIAQYKPICSKCMGTRQGQDLYMKEKEKKKVLKTNRYFDKENRKLIKQYPVEVVSANSLVKHSNLKDSNGKVGAVLPLEISPSGVDMNDGYDIRDKILDSSTALYIQGKPAAESRNDHSVNDNTSTLVHTPSRGKIADFNRRLQETPNDIRLWLDFVKFQDTIFAEDESFGSSSGVGYEGKLTRAVIEKKISIVDKALQSNPGSIELILHKIELNSDLVDAAKINKELEQLLFVHSANTGLWRYYLNYNKSKISLFSVTRMVKLYHKCFKVLLAVLEGKVQTHSVPENLCKDVLDLLMDYCYFLKQSGHREKATGTLQALLEYNILCPPAFMNVAKETKMAAFEEFWDSECPRVGCVGAPGWKVWFKDKDSKTWTNQSKTDSLEEQEEGIIEKKYPKSRSWLDIESLRETHHTLPWLPGEGQTDDDCEDADAVVVFDDVSPVLFDIPSDHFLALLVSMVALDQNVGHFEYSQQYVKHSPVFEHISQLPHISCDHLPNLTGPTETDLASNLLTHVIPCFTGDERTILTLVAIDVGLEGILKHRDMSQLNKSEKREVRRILKTVLKQEYNRNNLYIWAVYIQIERQIGKAGECWSIAETAIAMHGGAPVKWFVTEDNVGKKRKEEYVSGLVSVFVQYIDILLGIHSSPSLKLLSRSSGITMETKNKVQHVISCLLEGQTVDLSYRAEIPGATLLRVLAKFPKCIHKIMEHFQTSTGKSSLVKGELLGICWCYSVFNYCSHGIQSGLDVYTQILHDLESSIINDLQLRNDLEERLFESKMRLILYHMTVSPSPLHVLRENLDEALAKFPINSTFLALFIDVEKKARISGRINKYFDRQSRLTRSPVPVVFAVCDLISLACDVQDITAAGESFRDRDSLLNRARSWLENYLNQSGNVHCPLIWRIYLYLEALCNTESRSKGLFYRSIQQCASNKNLYKDGIRMLGEDKLQEVVDLMIEKELRVHLPVEELDILIE